MRSSRRTEIRVNSLEREIRGKTYCTRSKDRRLRDGPNFKKSTTSVQEQIASGVSGTINAQGLGDGPSGAKQCYRKARVLSGIV